MILDKLFGLRSRRQQAIDHYNLGLSAKYDGKWQASFDHNLRATELNPDDEAGWWNLGIAATALNRWPEAKRAWSKCGVGMIDGAEEALMEECVGCVRLDPNGCGEVVWGTRIDPARLRIANVPLPESDRLYRDIILHDGAAEGTRTKDGVEFPVFNELKVWRRSPYSTYSVEVSSATPESRISFESICEEKGIYWEDWGTVRHLCRQCSLGSPGLHGCSHSEVPEEYSRFGIAAKSEFSVRESLREWQEICPEIGLGPALLAVAGVTQ